MLRTPFLALLRSASVRQRFTAVADALLPRHCVLCGQPAGQANLCPPCRAELPRTGPACRSCALPLPSLGADRCGRCLRHPPPWDRAVAALAYCFPTDRLVCRFKFGRDFACGKVLGQELLAAVCRSEFPLPDLIVPVPLHRARHHFRAFNQSELLARQLGRALDVAVHSRLLQRSRRTRAQSGLDASDRKRNIRGAFCCKSSAAGQLDSLHVALVDDVMTTGATLAECVKSLKRAGVARVTIWVAARAPPF